MKGYLKKNKISLAIVLYLAVVSSFFYFLAVPSIKDISAKAQKIKQQEVDNNIDKEKISSLPKLEEGYENFKDNEEKLDIIMDPTKEVDFFKELESLAEQTRNKIEFKVQENYDKKSAAKKKGADAGIKDKLSYVNYLSMQIALEGDYVGLLDFVRKLENFHDYVNIVSVSSEKKIIREQISGGNIFSAEGQKEKEKEISREVINTILDVVVYTDKTL